MNHTSFPDFPNIGVHIKQIYLSYIKLHESLEFQTLNFTKMLSTAYELW